LKSPCKARAKESTASEKISTTKKKSSTLHLDNRKDAAGPLRNWLKPTYHRFKGVKDKLI
jgi:hypothetical protein